MKVKGPHNYMVTALGSFVKWPYKYSFYVFDCVLVG
jgi:hypothetical protein